jgi:hypothetical protein
LGLVFLVVRRLAPWAALLFVTFYGLGNGLNTIVKGTAMAQYVSRDHVRRLDGGCWACRNWPWGTLLRLGLWV